MKTSVSKILIIDYGWCNFHNILELVKSGHDVKVVTSSYEHFEDVPHKFWDQYGVEIVNAENRDSVLMKWLNNSDREIVINTHPILGHLSDSNIIDQDRFEYLGLYRPTAMLETGKWAVRESMLRRNILCPKVRKPIAPCVAKPIRIPKPTDHVSICMTQSEADRFSRDEYAEGMFYEEYIPKPTIETNVDFVVAKGKWSIRHTQEIIGEDTAKLAGKFQHWTKTSSFKPLPEWVEEITVENAVVILDWITKDVCDKSSFVGQITGLCTPNGDWYFCEINVRPEQTCSLPYFVTGDEYLESLRGKPEILGDAFPNDVDKLIVMPKEPDSIYPYHLHESYGVAIPCGLDIIDGEYRVSRHMRKRTPDGRIGLVICDKVIPEGFIHEMNNGNFEISAKMTK